MTNCKRGCSTISIGSQRTEISAAPGEWAAQFRMSHSVLCPDIFEPNLLQSLLESCDHTSFTPEAVPGLGIREVETPQRIGRAISLMLGRADFIEWLKAATGCKVERIEGRLVQTRANGLDGLDWHDDLNDAARRVGITISLSDSAFEGGGFELREVGSGAVVAKHRHERAGDALFFEIGSHLQHRLLPVTTGGPRRVFTGWFMER